MEAFALREEYAGTITSADDDGTPVEVPRFRGASFALRDGNTFDVAAELEAGGGVIRTNDTELAAHLRLFPPLKEVKADDDEDARTVSTLDDLTHAQLRDLPEAQNVTGRHSMRRDELQFRVQLAREAKDPNVALDRADDGTYSVAPTTDGADGGGDNA